MKSHHCKCGKELFAGMTKCRKCSDEIARLRSGQRSKGRRTVPVEDKYLQGPFGKYLTQIFARAE